MFLTPQSVYIIAEAGVNHNGDEKIAYRLIDIAVAAGSDAVKFQLFQPSEVVTKDAVCADYQSQNLNDHQISQLHMLQKLTLPHDAYVRLDAYCQKHHIDFLCTPFDHGSLDFLVKNTQMPFIKLASGEVTNGPLLLAAARTQMPIVLSTGMSDLDEIGIALSILHFGYAHSAGFPVDLTVPTPSMLMSLREKVTILHCVSQYPAPIKSTDLLAMGAIAETFSLPVGLSDHSLGTSMSIAASARGAYMIEKHFTFDVNAPGPDHLASLTASDLKAMVTAIREVSEGMGDGEKICRPEEINTRAIARRSVVASTVIAKGSVFTEENLICKRPAPVADALAPNQLWDLLGKSAKREYAADAYIYNTELT